MTALFCDVTGSTALGEQLDPEVLRGVMNRYFGEMRATIERHGGTVEKFIGDAVMAVFGIPAVREDDALRAVRAAAEIRERLPAIASEVGVTLRFRTGVNTGRVLSGEGENLAIGDAVNIAARLEQAAQPGEIVLGAETMRLVRDAVEVEQLEPLSLKGKSDHVLAYRLLNIDPQAAGVARHLEHGLIGRERELRVLEGAWERAVEERGCHLCTLLGAAGVGKSRLVAELFTAVEKQAVVLRGRCLHYGEGITFWPLVEALTPLGDVARPVLDRLATGGAAVPEELFWDIRRLIESLAAARPMILHVDDLQWGQPLLLDLIEHVADLSRGVPILLLCTARPELLEERPSWGGGKLNATTILLEPLGREDSEVLVAQLGAELSRDMEARVIAASEGNPLFLEEMVALAQESGTVAVPSTIQALLAARLERLLSEERELLERGAIEGEVFHRLGLRALVNEQASDQVGPRLAALVRKELIRPHPPTLPGDEAFRFRHLLIRDAAYERLPKGDRAELHERFALWLEHAGRDLVELDEIAGWHMEQAVHYQRELGREPDARLALRAARHLASAGGRADARNDVAAARNLLERALALTPVQDSLHARIAAELAQRLLYSGDLARVDELLSISERDPDARTSAGPIRLVWLIRAHPHDATKAVESRLPGMLAELEHRSDQRGLANAHLAAFWMHWLAARAAPAVEHARRAAAHAAQAGDDGLRARALGEYISALIWGQADVASMARELDVIERDGPGPYLMAFVNFGRGEIARLDRRFPEARRLALSALESIRALGMGTMESACMHHLALTEFSAAEPRAALAALLRSDALLAEFGERSFRSTSQALLAKAHELLGDADSARAAIALADELGAPEDIINYAITHAVRARLALADGDGRGAERWARSAVEYAWQTDFAGTRAEAKLELARILFGLDRSEEAAAEAREAQAIFEGKGDRAGAGEAQELLDQIGA